MLASLPEQDVLPSLETRRQPRHTAHPARLAHPLLAKPFPVPVPALSNSVREPERELPSKSVDGCASESVLLLITRLSLHCGAAIST